MSGSPRDVSDAELIHEEMAQARQALERYSELTTAEHTAQQERLNALEQRLEKLEKTTESLRAQVAAVLGSRIWRTLVRGGSIIGKLSSPAPREK